MATLARPAGQPVDLYAGLNEDTYRTINTGYTGEDPFLGGVDPRATEAGPAPGSVLWATGGDFIPGTGLVGSQQQADAAKSLLDLFERGSAGGEDETGGVRDEFGSPYSGSYDLFGEGGVFASDSFSGAMGNIADFLGLDEVDGWDLASLLAGGLFGPAGTAVVKMAEQVYGLATGDDGGAPYAGHGSGWSPGSYSPSGAYSAGGDNAGGGAGGDFGSGFSGGDFGFGGMDAGDFGVGGLSGGDPGVSAGGGFGSGADINDFGGWAGGGPVKAYKRGGAIEDPEVARLIAALVGEEDDPESIIDDFVASRGVDSLRDVLGYAQGGGVFEPVPSYDPAAPRPEVLPMDRSRGFVGGPTNQGLNAPSFAGGRPFGDPFTDLTGPGAQGRSIAASRRITGPGAGMDDAVPAVVNGQAPAALSDGEHVLSADVVSMLGDGSSDAGHRMLEDFASQVRQRKTGSPTQAPPLGMGRF